MTTSDTVQQFVTTDVGEARAFLDPQFYSSRLIPTGRTGRLSARLTTVAFRDILIGDVTFGADLRVSFPELDCYQVNVPIVGHLQTREPSGGPRLASPGTVAVYQPRSGAVGDLWSADCRVLGVKIEPGTLDRALTEMLGTAPNDRLRFRPNPAAYPEQVASWLRLVRWVRADAVSKAGLASHPLLRERVQELLVWGVLAMTDHQYREQMDAAGGRTVRPKVLRKVIETVEAHPDRPYTLASLAQIGGLSGRALQQNFQRHLGTTPMRFVRDIRMARAHDELRRGEPPHTTVAAVAQRWGFVHLGRFAHLYRTRYGVPPSETLHS